MAKLKVSSASSGAAHTSERPSLREQQKQLTRSRVVEAALDEFDNKGFAATTMEDIARRAGLNRGTIYLHFEGKAEILLTGIAAYKLDEESLFGEFGAAQTREEIESLFDHALTVWRRTGRIWYHARHAGVLEPAVQHWYDRLFARQIRLVRNSLQNRGFTPAAAEVRATLLISMWSEFMPRWASDGTDSGQKRKAAVAALSDFVEAAAFR